MSKDTTAIVVALATAATTVVLSMVLNSWAFTARLDGWFGRAVGVLLPLWVLALTFMGQRLWAVDRRIASASYGLAGFALLVSMPHLAHGYGRLGLPWWECWSLALVTDLCQVVAKLLVITLWTQATQATQAQPRATRKSGPRIMAA